MNQAIVYGVGVGPGDPELMTLKAVRLIRDNDVIAVPGKEPRQSVAYQIAVQSVPELAQKELVPLPLPMVKDREWLQQAHRQCADIVASYLDQGRNVICLTLGDPVIYSTFSYLQHLLEADGYPVELVSGVPSFCAAAARLRVPLAEWDEPLHIIPAVHAAERPLYDGGTHVFMKSAGQMQKVKAELKESGRRVYAAENCGMANERLYHCVDEIPDDAGYFTLMIAKERVNSCGEKSESLPITSDGQGNRTGNP